MKTLVYKATRVFIKGLLHLYFGKILIKGLENIPTNKPVLFLSNHQNAFLDTILIATDCQRSPFFLTRASVFKNEILNTIFTFFKMIPIYRLRDGISSLKNNEKTFELCNYLLIKNEAIVIFPEANHNLKRRVRPLSKGFTRILFSVLEQQSNLDIYLIPLGMNYVNATKFPDKAAVCYGKPIRLQEFYNAENLEETKDSLIKKVSDALKTLTTHIESEKDYDAISHNLEELGADFLQPESVNNSLISLSKIKKLPEIKSTKGWFDSISEIIFFMLNMPVLILWRKYYKPKIKEKEFVSTMRFAFSAAVFPPYYLVLFMLASFFFNVVTAISVILSVFFFNILYVKFN